MEAEQQALATMADNALQSIEQDGAELLAGDPMALKEPGEFKHQSPNYGKVCPGN